MGEMADIMAAMANVKDIQIDPNTGKTLGGSGKNLLEKAGVKTEQLPPSIKEQVAKSVANQKEERQEFGSYMDAYRELLNQPLPQQQTETPLEESTTQPTPPPKNIEAPTPLGHMDTRINYKENEEDYMAEMIANFKKQRY